MSQIYTRESDGKTFVCRATRETYEDKSASEVRRELIDMSDISGSKAVITTESNGSIHVVTGDDDGYSLGECVLSHLRSFVFDSNKESQNAIWCEEVNRESGESLLVIIRNGNVEYDSVIPPAQLDKDALQILTQSSSEFDIYIHGNVPISQPNDEEIIYPDSRESVSITLRDEVVGSFTILDSPVFDFLEASENYKFTDIAGAFKKAGLVDNTKLVLAIFLAVACLLIYFLLDNRETLDSEEVVIDNFKIYRSELASQDPVRILSTVLEDVETLSSIGGVDLLKVAYKNGRINAEGKITNAIVGRTTQSLERAGWNVQLKTGTFLFNRSIDKNSRGEPVGIVPHKDVVSTFLDNTIQAGIHAVVGQSSSTGFYKKSKISITYTDIGNVISQYIALTLVQQPVVIESISMKLGTNKSVDMAISFEVYGAI